MVIPFSQYADDRVILLGWGANVWPPQGAQQSVLAVLSAVDVGVSVVKRIVILPRVVNA